MGTDNGDGEDRAVSPGGIGGSEAVRTLRALRNLFKRKHLGAPRSSHP